MSNANGYINTGANGVDQPTSSQLLLDVANNNVRLAPDPAVVTSPDSVHIGLNTGESDQGNWSVAVGWSAGRTNRSDYAVAIGYGAGYSNQANNSIVLNATGANLNNSATTDAFFVKPVVQCAPVGGEHVLYYNPTTGEIFCTNV